MTTFISSEALCNYKKDIWKMKNEKKKEQIEKIINQEKKKQDLSTILA